MRPPLPRSRLVARRASRSSLGLLCGLLAASALGTADTARALRVAIPPPRPTGVDVLLVSDAATGDTNLQAALTYDGHNVTVVTGDFATQNQALRGDLSRYRLVVWIASASGFGDAHPDPALFSALEAYVQRGGRVLVTGYDAIASPVDPLLIAFLGGTGARDVPSPPGALSSVPSSLTTGVVDIRNLTPVGASSDRDALTGTGPDTVIVCPSSGDPGQGQWTVRRLGDGEIAWVSNGRAEEAEPNWLLRDPGAAGVYNAALRNFAFAAARGAIAPVPVPEPEPPPIEVPATDVVPPPPDLSDGDVPDGDVPDDDGALRFNSDSRAGFGWSVGVLGLGAHTTAEQRWFAGGTLEAAVTFDLGRRAADGRRAPALNGVVGDHYALTARGHVFARLDRGGDARWAVAVGGQLAAANALLGDNVRIPSLLGLVSPEVGAVFRSDRDPGLYLAWHAPFAFLLEDWLALELRASFFVIEGWRADPEDREALFTVSVGLSGR